MCDQGPAAAADAVNVSGKFSSTDPSRGHWHWSLGQPPGSTGNGDIQGNISTDTTPNIDKHQKNIFLCELRTQLWGQDLHFRKLSGDAATYLIYTFLGCWYRLGKAGGGGL